MEPQNQQLEKTKAAGKAGGLLFIGSMFFGMAIGSYMGDVGMGTMGGMGLGFILMAVVVVSESNKK